MMDRRIRTITITLTLIIGIGLLLHYWPQAPGKLLPIESGPEPATQHTDPAAAHPPASATADSPDQTRLEQHFQAAVHSLQNGQYEQALGALHQVLQLAPRLPEAHVNMGFALLGLERTQAAADFFTTAIELRPEQVNAYYGLALAYEDLNDLPAALGAMRSYVHLTSADDPRLPKARAALWEWEQPIPTTQREPNR